MTNDVDRRLISLRWHAVGGQVIAVLLGRFVCDLPLPLVPLFAITAATALTNVLFVRRLPNAAVIALDVVLLTALLLLSGGAANPFVVLYVPLVALATLSLERRHAAIVSWLVIVCGAVVFTLPPRFEFSPALYRHGLVVALGFSAVLVFVFMARLSRALQRHAQVASLGARAADAAHELGSPLATIAVAANDLPPSDDASLIRDEVERCRTILERLSHEGEVPCTTRASEVAHELSRLSPRVGVTITNDALIVCPPNGLRAALTNLLTNALQASTDTVQLRVESDPRHCRFVVSDHGTGMDVSRAGDPFFTTKGGMGLGLFLAFAFAERVGGRVHARSQRGHGTTMTLAVPRG